MNSEEAIKKIDDLANVVAVVIPDEIEIDGVVYRIKEDISHGDRDEMLVKYLELYNSLRDRIKEMDNVPEEMVEKALILRRAVMFLKDFHGSDEVDDAKRWMDYIKKVGV